MALALQFSNMFYSLKLSSNDRSARLVLSQNGARSCYSGNLSSASGVSCVFSSLTIDAGIPNSACAKSKVVRFGGKGG